MCDKKNVVKDEELEKVTGGSNGSESVRIELDNVYFTGTTGFNTMLNIPSDNKDDSDKSK